VICAELFDEYGRIDVLVNVAGISLPKAEGQQVQRDFERTIATNLIAAHHCCQAVSGYMKKSGGGSIINVTSIGSVLGFPGNPAYIASKGGLRMLTQALALDLAPDQIRVNNLAPGYIRTDMTEASFNDTSKHAERLQHMIIKRWGAPEDLAGAVIFLASRASAYVTGIDLFVDGGWTAKGL
jgi:gluconate 5-dehydrogenase